MLKDISNRAKFHISNGVLDWRMLQQESQVTLNIVLEWRMFQQEGQVTLTIVSCCLFAAFTELKSGLILSLRRL